MTDKPQRTRATAAENKARNAKYLVEDYEESKALWLAGNGKVNGHRIAWESKWLRKNMTQAEMLAQHDAQLEKDGEFDKRPKLLDKKEDKRVLEPNAFSIARTKEGWVIMEYAINGSRCALLNVTKPEGKHFAVSRLQKMMTKGIV